MAGSKTNSFETSLLNHIFNNADIANIGDATGVRGSAAAGSLYLALFTASPGETGAGTEANYTGYARVAVARTAGGWTISGAQASNASAITFGQCTAGSNTIVSFGIMTASSAGTMLFWGDLTSSLAVSNGITPEFAIGALTITED